jgi:hypothetical protein
MTGSRCLLWVKFGHTETFAKRAAEPGSGRRNKRSATTVKQLVRHRSSKYRLSPGAPSL